MRDVRSAALAEQGLIRSTDQPFGQRRWPEISRLLCDRVELSIDESLGGEPALCVHRATLMATAKGEHAIEYAFSSGNWQHRQINLRSLRTRRVAITVNPVLSPCVPPLSRATQAFRRRVLDLMNG
jgi:hypothetical protein